MGADRQRAGVALLAAIVTVGVVGTLLIAGYYSARVNLERGRAASRSAEIAALADGALATGMAAWDSAARFAQPVGATSSIAVDATDPAAKYRAWVTRLNARLYWMSVSVADRRDTTLTARRGTPILVNAPDFPPDSGDHPELEPLGDDTFATLAGRASLRIPAGAAIEAPVSGLAYAAGDLTISGGSGSGVLLVAGDLTLRGPGSYRGVILATGSVHVAGAGTSVVGRLLAPAEDSVKILTGMNLEDDSMTVVDAEWHAGVPRIVAGPGLSNLR